MSRRAASRRTREAAAGYMPGSRVLFDDEVVVAAMISNHPRHLRAMRWFRRAVRGELAMVLAQHSLAECFSLFTVLPLQPAISPERALGLIEEGVLGLCRATVIGLTATEQLDALRRCTRRGGRGRTVHDAITARCAEKAGARILTFAPRRLPWFCRNGAADLIDP